MKNDNRSLLAQYQQADFHTRLNLYLQYPELRDHFIAIDQSEPTDGVQRRAGRFQNPPATRLSVLLSASVGCFRRLLAPVKL